MTAGDFEWMLLKGKFGERGFRMISCEGIKAFRGTATIRPKNDTIIPFKVSGDWVFKNGYWYCGGRSFGADIVTDIREEPNVSAIIERMKEVEVTPENLDEVREIWENVIAWLCAVQEVG